MTKAGTILEGKYEILKEIGRGGMSYVYLAMDTRLNKQWAVKEVKKNANNQQNQLVVQSLITEANLMKKLNHPSFPRIVDIIEEYNTIYVVMDYVEGESLENIVKLEGRQSEENVINWAIQLCNALEYLHTRKPPIVHRDIKPANIIRQPEPQNSIKVLDLGIAKELVDKDSEGTKCIGTPGYASPEQSITGMKLDGRSDIYSVGATMHHLLTGLDPRRNIGFKKLRSVTGKVSEKTEGLEYIIEKCLNQDANLRYQTCAELRYDLENVETLTKKYRRDQKNKLNIFTTFTCLAIVFALVSGILGFTYVNRKSDTIDNYLLEMSNSYSILTSEYANWENDKSYENIYMELKEIDDGVDSILSLNNDQFTSKSFAAYSVYMYKLNNLYKLSTLNGSDEKQAECSSIYNDFKENAVKFSNYLEQVEEPELAVYASTLNALSFIFDDSQDTKKAEYILNNLNSYVDTNPNLDSNMKNSSVKEIMDQFDQGVATGFLGDGSEISKNIEILTLLANCIEKSNNLLQGHTSNTGLAGETNYSDIISEYGNVVEKTQNLEASSSFRLYVYGKVNSFVVSNANNQDLKDELKELCAELYEAVDSSKNAENNSEMKASFEELEVLIAKTEKDIDNYSRDKLSKNE